MRGKTGYQRSHAGPGDRGRRRPTGWAFVVEESGVLDELHGQAFAAHGGAVDFHERAQFPPSFAVGDGVVQDGVGHEPLALSDGMRHLGSPVPWAVFVPEAACVGREWQVGAYDGQRVRRLQRRCCCRGDGVRRAPAQEGVIAGQKHPVRGEVPGMRPRPVQVRQRREVDEARGAQLVQRPGDQLAGAGGPQHLEQLAGRGHPVQGERGQDLQAQWLSRAGGQFGGRNT